MFTQLVKSLTPEVIVPFGDSNPEDLTPWREVYSLNDVHEIVMQHILHNKPVGVMWSDAGFWICISKTVVPIVFLEDITVLQPATKLRLPQIKVGGTVCTVITDYMGCYNVKDNYLTRWYMYGYIHQMAKAYSGEILVEEGPFDEDKVISLQPWTNRFKKPSVILKYQGEPPIFGLSQIQSRFPDMSRRQLQRLYLKWHIKMPRKLRE